MKNPLYKFSFKAEGGTNSVNRRSRASSERNASESAICPARGQASAEIVRVECAKRRRERDMSWRQPSAEIVRVERARCRRERDLSWVRATLCGDRACRVRETQARARFVLRAGNPLRRSRASSARNEGESGESAICPVPAKPSAESARVECAKCRRECDGSGTRATLFSKTLVRGVSGEVEDENWGLGNTTLVRGVSGELEDENWGLGSTTLVRGVSRELEDENWRLCSTTEYLGSLKMRTGDFVVQL